MPPKRRRSRTPSYPKGRSKRASLKKEWAAKKRRKFSLNTRTTLANRKAIKKITKTRETKWKDDMQGTQPTNYDGQWINLTQVDYQGNDTSVPPVPLTLRLLREINPGTGVNERIGDWIQIKSVTVHARFRPEGLAPATSPYNRIRIYCVLDRNPNQMIPGPGGGQPQVPSMALLKDQTTTSDNFMNFYNPDTTGKEGRFKVLAVKTAYVGSTVLAANVMPTTYPAEQTFTFNFGRGYKINYAAGTGTPMNQELVILAHSDSRVTPHPYVELKCKVRYYDS